MKYAVAGFICAVKKLLKIIIFLAFRLQIMEFFLLQVSGIRYQFCLWLLYATGFIKISKRLLFVLFSSAVTKKLNQIRQHS